MNKIAMRNEALSYCRTFLDWLMTKSMTQLWSEWFSAIANPIDHPLYRRTDLSRYSSPDSVFGLDSDYRIGGRITAVGIIYGFYAGCLELVDEVSVLYREIRTLAILSNEEEEEEETEKCPAELVVKYARWLEKLNNATNKANRLHP